MSALEKSPLMVYLRQFAVHHTVGLGYGVQLRNLGLTTKDGLSPAGLELLELEAENARLRAELERHKPEEREAECFCETPLIWLPTGRSFVCSKPCWLNEGTDEPFFPGNKCPNCGAELGEGIARRNADAARVARVRAALDSFTYHEDCGNDLYRARTAGEEAAEDGAHRRVAPDNQSWGRPGTGGHHARH
jgi:hypothetical protein